MRKYGIISLADFAFIRRFFMKKLLSIILLACMTLGIIPAFMIAANGSTSTPLGVTHVSMSENYHENKGDAVNWALAWNSSNKTRVVPF